MNYQKMTKNKLSVPYGTLNNGKMRIQMDNNTQLRIIYEKYNLTYGEIDKICEVSKKTVESWMAHEEAKNYRKLSNGMLKLIRLQLEV